MAQVKCNLLKPVDNLTGNIFMFSQYAQDLTKQYANPDSYRCVPSKYVALNLDFEHLSGENQTQEEFDRLLGNVFQNYFENACTFLRSKYKELGNDWNPENTRTLLFQTLEKYQLIKTTNLRNTEEDLGERTDGSTGDRYGAVSGVSDNIQYIGDINIYSYNDNEDGVGYSEIYCYIPNEAKCTDYQLVAVTRGTAYKYPRKSELVDLPQEIMGYELDGDPYLLYNGLNSLIWKSDLTPYFVDRVNDQSCYGVGVLDSQTNVLVPACLTPISISDDHERKEDGQSLTKFDVNAIVLLYDIVSKGTNGDITIAKNIPLGIYFTGQRVLGSTENTTTEMTNKIVKYVDSGQIYNQGTSYGLRVCTRFLNEPNSTQIIETSTNGSNNVSEIAPVLEKMGETLMSVQDILNDKDKLYQMLKDHLAQFKDNKVNVPYVRQLGNKKYWFVNGKNTGAVAQYDYVDPTAIIEKAITEAIKVFYTKEDIDSILNLYVSKEEFNVAVQDFATRLYVDEQLEKLRRELLVRIQGPMEPDEYINNEQEGEV